MKRNCYFSSGAAIWRMCTSGRYNVPLYMYAGNTATLFAFFRLCYYKSTSPPFLIAQTFLFLRRVALASNLHSWSREEGEEDSGGGGATHFSSFPYLPCLVGALSPLYSSLSCPLGVNSPQGRGPPPLFPAPLFFIHLSSQVMAHEWGTHYWQK